jgi:hypothetical protein
LPRLAPKANSGKEGFPTFPEAFKVRFVHASEHALKTNKPTADEDTMNIETIELIAVAETTNAQETVDLLALSLDDMDLVAGGTTVGTAY